MKTKYFASVSLSLVAFCFVSLRPSPAQNQALPATEAPIAPVRVGPQAARKQQSEASAAKISQGRRDRSLRFEANLGQTDSRVNFLSRGSGYVLFLSGTDAVMSLEGPAVRRNRKLDASPANSALDR
jgi:hypothetical protein